MDMQAAEVAEVEAGQDSAEERKPFDPSPTIAVDEFFKAMHDGTTVLDVSSAPNYVKAGILDVLTDFLAHHSVIEMRWVFPLDFLVAHHESLRDANSLPCEVTAGFDDEGVDEQRINMVFLYRALLARLEEAVETNRAAFQKQRDLGKVGYANLHLLYPEESMVLVHDAGMPWGGIVKDVESHVSMFGRWTEISIEIVHAVRGKVETGTRTATVPWFPDTMAIDCLGVTCIPEVADIPAWMTERGRRVVGFMEPGTVARYVGDLLVKSWWGDRRFRSHGRVVIDPKHYAVMDGQGWRNAQQGLGIDMEEERGRQKQPARVLGDMLAGNEWRMWPQLCGFSLSTKMWGVFDVESMHPVRWRTDSFDMLVMDEGDKRIVKALVSHHGGGFQDLVEDKGGGLIFLLEGPPGEGKTLLAETVGETLQRILYSVSVGELGTDPVQLEKSLRALLDLAMAWNAVILLDEADIFLEERQADDILRNAMVGVFLRLLEYHQGVLFLTTNRARNIDQAFYSRISAAIRYKAGDEDKRRRVWTNLLRAAGEDVTLAGMVCGTEMNGRQVKNCLRMAQTLARSEGREKVDEALLRQAIEFSTRFSAGRAS